ncbi:MAG: hypothetical protein ILA06_09820 [Bacteroidaceae bacterium]|nr:hypothetical protein [Bacteroidaceae bacterium]
MRGIAHNLVNSFFSATTLSLLKPHIGLSERYQRRAIDVTLGYKLTPAYGKYHLAMLHRELFMSEEKKCELFICLNTYETEPAFSCADA